MNTVHTQSIRLSLYIYINVYELPKARMTLIRFSEFSVKLGFSLIPKKKLACQEILLGVVQICCCYMLFGLSSFVGCHRFAFCIENIKYFVYAFVYLCHFSSHHFINIHEVL
jgi:hypothetical protein